MNRVLALLALPFLAGCVTYGTMDEPDAFVDAATSWKGGQIKQMISAFGQPNNGFMEPSEYRNGTASWLYDGTNKPNPYQEQKMRTNCSGGQVDKWGNVNVNCSTYDANANRRQSYELGQQAGAAFKKKCIVNVEFDESGSIINVFAQSQNCSNGIEQELSDQLTRRAY